MKDGYFRLAAATPQLRVADCEYNGESILRLIEQAAAKGAAAVIFPELCLTGYTCGDLFGDCSLIKSAEKALAELIAKTAKLDILCGVGLPVPYLGGLYNCVAVFKGGRLLGLPAKENIPNYGEFYELRHFTPCKDNFKLSYAGFEVSMGRQLFICSQNRDFCIGVEICEDLWVLMPPSTELAQMGASVILNASCSDETIGKADYRKSLVSSHSGRLLCAYCYADSGIGESTTDLVFAGHRLIAENAAILCESQLFTTGLSISDIDVELLAHERRRMNTFKTRGSCETVEFSYKQETIDKFEPIRRAPKSPFMPVEAAQLRQRCGEIAAIQSAGLQQRLRHIGAKNVVLGLSGGLDSTLALLITAKAFDGLGLDRKGIHCFSMPCFGTSARTKNNAEQLAAEMGISFKEISIKESVLQHFKDIGHDPAVLDTSYENAQARERTQLLMDISNKLGGIVIGTGDLSELALGWATYNGDHMSMYGVNASVPKTLVRHMVAYFAGELGGKAAQVLLDILDTPVSPELLPPKEGEISQKTEDLVGPYELHDFFLYYMLRYGFGPGKIYRMAICTFEGLYSEDCIKKWLRVFYGRFFSQQFKRSCMPDGPKVGSIGLSPRGDFRMPSDASCSLWMKIIDSL